MSPLLVLVLGIALIFVLIIVFKLNGFIALFLASMFVGVFMNMPLLKIVSSIETGFGGTLGHLGIIIGLGGILGKFLSEGGAAQQISMTLINKFGKKNVGWAIALASFVLGITLFWEVAFIILVPIVFTVVIAAELPLLSVAMPMLVAISVTHCFLPPHPGPTAVVGIFSANIGLTLLYGLIIAIPVLIIGVLYSKTLRKLNPVIPKNLVTTKIFTEEELPTFGVSVLIAICPVILIVINVIAGFVFPKGSPILNVTGFIGNADIALLISVFIALYFFGLRRKRKPMQEMMNLLQSALLSLGGIVFIIGAGGAFKQVILDSGMSTYIGGLMSNLHLSPLVLAYLVTVVIRMAVGSATVTVFTSSAIILPLIAGSGIPPELFVLAVTTGSTFGGPPNDAAFWMTKEFFNLSLWENVRVYSIMLTIVSVCGFIGVMALSLVV